jgi:ABC-2 type transport system permease protein
VPAEALTGHLAPNTLVLAAVLAVVLFILSRIFWKIGLRHYTGTSA